MPKNKGKGGKNRRRGKNENEEKRELIFKEDGQEYAQVRRGSGAHQHWRDAALCSSSCLIGDAQPLACAFWCCMT